MLRVLPCCPGDPSTCCSPTGPMRTAKGTPAGRHPPTQLSKLPLAPAAHRYCRPLTLCPMLISCLWESGATSPAGTSSWTPKKPSELKGTAVSSGYSVAFLGPSFLTIMGRRDSPQTTQGMGALLPSAPVQGEGDQHPYTHHRPSPLGEQVGESARFGPSSQAGGTHCLSLSLHHVASILPCPPGLWVQHTEWVAEAAV